jgi:lysozyme
MERAKGFDLSAGDGKVDFQKAKAAGITFMYTKASQRVVDATYYRNMDGGKSVGFLRGAFHYLDLGESELTQADRFINTIKNDIGELPPVLDFEQDPNGLSFPSMTKSIRQGKAWNFVDKVQKALGVKVGIYSGYYYWGSWGDLGLGWTPCPFWLAWWATEAYIKFKTGGTGAPLPWKDWKFWQFGLVNGPTYGVEALSLDMNVYNGTIDELKAWAKPAPIALTWDEAITDWARHQPNPYTGPDPS